MANTVYEARVEYNAVSNNITENMKPTDYVQLAEIIYEAGIAGRVQKACVCTITL